MFDLAKHSQEPHSFTTLDEAVHSYYDSAKGVRINRDRVNRELRGHGTCDEDVELFFISYPACDDETWDAQEVLRFLGY